MLRTAIATALAVGACWHDPAPAPVGPSPANRVLVVRHESPELLDYLPIDSELVAATDFQALRRSEVWHRFVEPLLAKNLSDLGVFKTVCGFDPFEAIRSVAIGAKGFGAKHPDLVFVIQGPERTKVIGCLTKLTASAAADGDVITRDGDDVFITTKPGIRVGIAFVGDHTLIISDPNATVAQLAQITSGRSSVRTSPAFTAMYDQLDRRQTVWGIINGNSTAFNKVPLGFKPKALFGTLNVTDALALDLRIRMDTPDVAAKFATNIMQSAGQFQTFVDKVDVTSDGPDARIVVAMSSQKLASMIALVGGRQGGLGGTATSPFP